MSDYYEMLEEAWKNVPEKDKEYFIGKNKSNPRYGGGCAFICLLIIVVVIIKFSKC